MFCSVDQKRVASSREVTQSVVSEAQFAGLRRRCEQRSSQLALRHSAQEAKQSEEERLKLEARIQKNSCESDFKCRPVK